MTAALTPAQVLRDAKALISDPAKWTQKAAARDIEGAEVAFGDEDAVCWCALGAIWRAVPNNDVETDAIFALSNAMGMGVPLFNDAHTHPEVLAAFDRAIELAEARQ